MLILILMCLHKTAHKHLMYSDKYSNVRKITFKWIELANLKFYLEYSVVTDASKWFDTYVHMPKKYNQTTFDVSCTSHRIQTCVHWILYCPLIRTYCFIGRKPATKYVNKNWLTDVQSVNRFRCSNVTKKGIYLHKSLCRNMFSKWLYFSR